VNRAQKAALLSPAALAAGAAAWLAYRLARTPRPSPEDAGLDEGLDKEEWGFTTADGITLRGARYAVPGAQPVILAHGFGGNGNEFDLPRAGRNLAVHLARAGYDVWMSSFRGNGRGDTVSDSGGWGHSIDHLGAYDAPALIEGVTRATGRRPAWLGHSMGGMVLFEYLQGATFREAGGETAFHADEGLARERNLSIAAGVAIGSPPAFYWEGDDFFGRLSSSPAYRAVLKGLMSALRPLEGRGSSLPLGIPVSRLAGRSPRLAAAIALSPLGVLLYNRGNIEAGVGASLIERAGDDVSPAMARQLIHGIVNHDYLSRDRGYSYTANMHRITAPMLFISGTEDFASAACIGEHGYERVASERKEFKCFPGFGHTDLIMGKAVDELVYPAIVAWLDEVTG
jgi:pimeloyl-ACP methyl ester carboxylesterase